MPEIYPEDYLVKPRPVSRTLVVTEPTTPLIPVVKDDLATRLRAILQEDPGTAEVTKNPWLHDVFVRKIKALVE
jgi:hypothetical protein